jgi:hypothetical protein
MNAVTREAGLLAWLLPFRMGLMAATGYRYCSTIPMSPAQMRPDSSDDQKGTSGHLVK